MKGVDQVSLEIRRYEHGDAEAVWRLHVLGLEHAGAYSGSGPWDEDLRDIESAYLSVGGEFFVVTHQGQVVGMGALRRASGDQAEIKRMRVHPEFQRRALGQTIYDHLEERARQLGYRTLRLDTTVQQEAAQALYRKNGFVEVGRAVLGDFDCLIFEKRIF